MAKKKAPKKKRPAKKDVSQTALSIVERATGGKLVDKPATQRGRR
jgi:hypothetical protein